MRDVTGLDGDLGCDVRAVEQGLGGFDEQEFFGSTSFEIDTLGFEVFIVGIVGFWEAVFKENDQRITGFTEGTGDDFLSFGDGCGNEDGTISGLCEAFIAEGGDVGGSEAAGTLENGTQGVYGEEDIAEGGTGDAADICLLMDAEEVGAPE